MRDRTVFGLVELQTNVSNNSNCFETIETQNTNTFWTTSGLIISKPNHIILTLPNPYNETLKEID